MAPDAETSTLDDATASRALPDLQLLTAAAVLTSSDSALSAALRRLSDELGSSAPILAGFGNFAPPDPGPR
jgi:FXSXX-COOH protein